MDKELLFTGFRMAVVLVIMLTIAYLLVTW